jgi:hypothetical protein
VRFGTGHIGGLIALSAAVVALAAPGTAGAGLLTTGTSSNCDPNTSQAFGDWGDTAYYRLAPGGTFEGTTSWSVSGGAKTVAGNDPYGVVDGTRSLYLPAGSSATSPSMCFDFGDWHARFMTRNTGATGATLEVDILVRSLLGVLSVLDGGTVSADGTWDPSPEMSATLTNVTGLLTLTKSVSFRLTARGTGAAFQVDNFFLDPFKSG